MRKVVSLWQHREKVEREVSEEVKKLRPAQRRALVDKVVKEMTPDQRQRYMTIKGRK